jgi:hypothetical protein
VFDGSDDLAAGRVVKLYASCLRIPCLFASHERPMHSIGRIAAIFIAGCSRWARSSNHSTTK